MSKCKYPRSVVKNNIEISEDENAECCFKVYIPICSEGKDLLIICRRANPIGHEQCNRLLSRVVKYILGKFDGVKSITCLFLFVSYDIDKIYKNKIYEKENIKLIRDELKNADIIVAAWGEPYKGLEEVFNSKIAFIYQYIREAVLESIERKKVCRIGDLTKKGYPKHYLAWKLDDEVQELI